eukprot:scaffold43310_cov77-Phaeocystis_antarctica.AAC.1
MRSPHMLRADSADYSPSETWPSRSLNTQPTTRASESRTRTRAGHAWQACTSRAPLDSLCASTATPATERSRSTGASLTTTTRTR